MSGSASPSGGRTGDLLLTTDFPPNLGGVARYLDGLAGALAGRGPVEVVAYGVEPSRGDGPSTAGGSAPAAAVPREARRAVHHVTAPERRVGERPGDAFPPLRRLNTILHHRRLLAGARRALEAVLRPDESRRAHVGVWTRAAHAWCRRLRREGVPYGLFAYGLELRRDPGPIWRRRRREDVRRARAVFACSGATASLVREVHPGVDPVVVHPGIAGPADPAAARAAGERLRRELEVPEDARVLATVGRLVRRKGVHLVLEALASGGLDDPGIRYVVAGSGPDREALEARARALGVAERVRFLGRVDEATKWAVHALADVFVMPAGEADGEDWEGFGIVYLEAAVLGVPSVAARSGGAPEAVADGRTGRVVEPGSVAGLRAALLDLLSDEERRRAMGRRARERALREFTWEAAAGKVLAAWRG